MQKLLGPTLWSMSAFMKNFTEPGMVLFYDADEKGWWIVSWVFPFMGGGTWGLWVRQDKRASGSRVGLSHIMRSLDFATTRHPVIVNTTKQPEIIAKTQRLGYTYIGMIPLLFDGEDCHVLHMTREVFAPMFERWSKRNGPSQ